MLVMDENGRGTMLLDVQGFDLADSPTPGFWYLKGGWIHASPHRCLSDTRNVSLNMMN